MTSSGLCEICKTIAHRYTYREDIKGWYCNTHWDIVFNESIKNETSEPLQPKVKNQLTADGIVMNRKTRKMLEAQARRKG